MAGTYGPTMPSKRKLEGEEEEVGPRRPDTPPKKARVMGPALPPPSSRPDSDKDEEDEEDDDSDDDYGPSLPPPASSTSARKPEVPTAPVPSASVSKPEAPKRDDWMLKPPEQLDLSARMDPTKLKNRKFNTGNPARPGASKNAGGGPSNTWTETVEEKRKRLQNEVMGIQAPAASSVVSEHDAAKALAAERAEKMSKHVRDYNEKNRSKSLYSQHKTSAEEQEKDDPSARAFDKEKDIRAPSKISHSQRKEMLNKSADFSSRFAGGNFL
ncbi:uncharacterized protein GIQ15_04811 [Arthroderma uncinatum]|uniref:uncharacterized protein n=1 Tax=Arthroderma uncinatum TaxID=74035 RepID=UPI00144AA701|nr:uncharacterized protein GIQ15_04811 [Arthroderma uncinatum]KAF3482052.1 hypothetical protein GIQ15_04811 [Arthroderma uncinatum]